jgi:microfibrillar-associated protein 1
MSLRFAAVRKEGEKNGVERVKITRHFAGKDSFAKNDEFEPVVPVKQEKPMEKRIEVQKFIHTIQHDSDEDDSDEETLRRERLKKRLLERQQQEEEEAEEEKGYEGDDQIDESEDDNAPQIEVEEAEEILKPLFIPKTHRSTIFEQQKHQEEQEKLRSDLERKKLERQLETKEMIKARRIVQEEDTDELPDDEDDEEDEAEYETWKLREILRVKNERKIKFARLMEQAEIERRRNMTDMERKYEDEELERMHGKKEKKNWRFLQRYMHGGAFYQDEKEKDTEFGKVLKRDYVSAPTGQDVMDKEVLPSVMQVRKWGQKGRTKYTHLTAEDTTFVDKDAPLLQDDAKRKLARDIVVQQQNALKKRKL